MHMLELMGGLLDAGWQGWLQRPLALFEDTSNIVFFKIVTEFLQSEIDRFGIEMLGRTPRWLGTIALSQRTILNMLPGWRFVTGLSRDSPKALGSHTLRGT